MLAALPHLTSIKLDLDFVGTIGPRQNNVANDASFGHQENCEFLLLWAYLESLLPVIAGKKSRFGVHQHGGDSILRVFTNRSCVADDAWSAYETRAHFMFS